jgi:crossover junction endodeoxyribonuclease RuvC
MPSRSGPSTRAAPTSTGSGSVLGVDPGLLRTGYALLDRAGAPREARLIEAGVIRLPRERSLPDRLIELEKSLATIIGSARPNILACEELYAHYRHPRTAILMAHARGVILALAARCGLRVLPVAATNVKKLLTGNGHAGKRQVQAAVAATLGLPALPEPPDVADAIAIALCGLRLWQAETLERARAGVPTHRAPGGVAGTARVARRRRATL